MLEIWRVGTPVKFGDYEAVVLSVRITLNDAIAYELGYWVGDAGSKHWIEQWVLPFLISSHEAKGSFGFSQAPRIG